MSEGNRLHQTGAQVQRGRCGANPRVWLAAASACELGELGLDSGGARRVGERHSSAEALYAGVCAVLACDLAGDEPRGGASGSRGADQAVAPLPCGDPGGQQQ